MHFLDQMATVDCKLDVVILLIFMVILYVSTVGLYINIKGSSGPIRYTIVIIEKIHVWDGVLWIVSMQTRITTITSS